MNNDGLYSISAVSHQTGVNPVTLRAWERRYGLIKPTRTQKGHRLFTEEDIEKIKKILQLLDEGIAISRVNEAIRIATEREETPAGEDFWHAYQQDMLTAVSDFDGFNLERLYNEALSLYPIDIITRRLLLPLLKLLGERWLHSSSGIAEEHFFSVFMRNKLGARFHHRNSQNSGPQLIAACLPGEQHEFGLLLFALMAHTRGIRIILLGADMPLEPLAVVVRSSGSNGVVLSGSIDFNDQRLQDSLSKLSRETGVPIWVGGRCSIRYRATIEAAGAISAGDDPIVGVHMITKYFNQD